MRRALCKTKQAILRRLSANAFCSGQELAEELDISRSAVARHVKELNEQGVDIFSVKGKGYKLAKPLDLIQIEPLQSLLDASLQGAELHVFPSIDSTNQFWLDQPSRSIPNGSACFAEYQSAGRGRRGRQWHSPMGAAIYFSTWWQSGLNLSELMGLSVAMGLAVTRWLNSLGAPAQVKWPNDIYIQGKKVAGILVELDAQPDGRGRAVVGVGLNVQLPQQAQSHIDQPWTQLADHLQPLPCRTELAAGLYQAIRACLEQFESEGLAHTIEDWARWDFYYGKPICLLMGQHQISGICRGVDGQGALRVESEQGLKSYFGGEISVRGADVTG